MHIGIASTIDKAVNVIFDYLIMCGCKDPFTCKKQEIGNVLKYDVTSHNDFFEVEMKDSASTTFEELAENNRAFRA